MGTLNWGVLSTVSTRDEATHVGDAFGNPYSHADVAGVPYFFASDLDASMIDIFTAASPSPRVSFAMSEAELVGKDAKAACTIGTAVGDPEFPGCARLVLSGNMVRVEVNTTEESTAKAALVERHPSFAEYPAGHDFFVAKLELDGIWLIDFVGGAAIIKPEDYFKAKVVDIDRPMVTMPRRAQPPANDTIGTARWMVNTLWYGALSTISTRTEGTHVGDAFGNPYSHADVDGKLYFYASDVDATCVDLFTADMNNSRASYALSEASLAGTEHNQSACTIGSGLGDPENPPCARLVLTGNIVKLQVDSDEEKAAHAALIERHPSFKSYPKDHGFYVAKMEIDGIWLIDFYGGAAIIDPSEYYSYSPSLLI